MSFLCDYHLHSRYSHDARESLKSIAEACIRQGMDEICLTDHADVLEKPEGRRWGNYRDYLLEGGPDYDKLLQELEEVRGLTEGRLRFRFGLELGQPQANPEAADKLLSAWPFEFIIGSIHYMPGDEDLYYYDFASMDRSAFFNRDSSRFFK